MKLNKKIIISFLLLAAAFFPFYSFAATRQPAGKMILFWQVGCSHCAKVEDYIKKNDLDKAFDIEMKEIRYNQENRKEFFEVCGKYNIPLNQQGVPMLLFNGQCLIGDKPIIKALQESIQGETKAKPAESEDKPNSFLAKKQKLTFPLIIGAASVDAINPCAFAVLIILMATVLASGNRKRALFSGLSFSTAIYVSYLLIGLGIYKIFSLANFSHWFNLIIGGLAIIIGVFNIKDYIWYGGGGFIMEVPRRWRPKMKSIIHSATSPMGSAAIGFIVSSFLLPCTSGPYIVILAMLSQKAEFLTALLWLLLYNAIFILPMVVISVIIYKGLNPGKIEETRQKNLKNLHLVAGIIMVIMGLVILFNFV